MGGTYFFDGLPFSSLVDNFEIRYSYSQFKNKPVWWTWWCYLRSGHLPVHLKWFWSDQSNTNRPIGQTVPPNHRSMSWKLLFGQSN